LIERPLYVVLFLLSFFLTTQGAITLYLMLYTWWQPRRLAAAASPVTFLPPTLRFTAILPARHEEAVIAGTIARVWAANYPRELLEVVLVCEQGDTGTIGEGQRACAAINHPHVRVLTFGDGPINKPHGLNHALRHTTHEVVTVFDAEDDVHPDIFQIINTVMLRQRAPIVQAGVQLMDFRSSWFAVHNVLEYFFWFKSRLHFHARVGMVPLGGNTVFIERRYLDMAGGWDEHCLTEDADLGIRLSTRGVRVAVTYDAAHATREETPPTVRDFIKQRTRWNQGFLQVLRKGDWRHYPGLAQRLLALFTLSYPFVQAAFGLLWPLTFIMVFTVKMPVGLAMFSFLPLYLFAFQFVIGLLGLLEFARAYAEVVRPTDFARYVLGFLPYQLLLGLGAIRSVYRELRGMNNWEKTAHTGAHRPAATTLEHAVLERSRGRFRPDVAPYGVAALPEEQV
jgi:cellulose synthase/poly-beta-1,6-N-acetylglucosamine synthase-like glycosyltransferase